MKLQPTLKALTLGLTMALAGVASRLSRCRSRIRDVVRPMPFTASPARSIGERA